MNEMNFHASIQNLSRMERYQDDVHKLPASEQSQNEDKLREEAEQRLGRPNEPEQSEGKNINPDARRREYREGKKRDKKQDSDKKHKNKNGHIDLEA